MFELILTDVAITFFILLLIVFGFPFSMILVDLLYWVGLVPMFWAEHCNGA